MIARTDNKFFAFFGEIPQICPSLPNSRPNSLANCSHAKAAIGFNGTPERPAYDVGSTYSVELGFGSFIEITEDWRVLFNVAVQKRVRLARVQLELAVKYQASALAELQVEMHP